MTLHHDQKRAEAHALGAVAWTVREFVLVGSLVGHAHHIHLERWPLHG